MLEPVCGSVVGTTVVVGATVVVVVEPEAAATVAVIEQSSEPTFVVPSVAKNENFTVPASPESIEESASKEKATVAGLVEPPRSVTSPT